MDIIETQNTFNKLNVEFTELTKNANKKAYDDFGWKCMDFIDSIKIDSSLNILDRMALKNILQEFKTLANNLKNFKAYLDSIADMKLSELSSGDKAKNESIPSLTEENSKNLILNKMIDNKAA